MVFSVFLFFFWFFGRLPRPQKKIIGHLLGDKEYLIDILAMYCTYYGQLSAAEGQNILKICADGDGAGRGRSIRIVHKRLF